MLKQAALLSVAIGLSLGGTCTITGPGLDGGLPGSAQIPLDKADAAITIVQAPGVASAEINADIRDRHGRIVDLAGNQSVHVNDMLLAGPNTAGQYTASLPAAGAYTIVVREPTRGIEETELDAPAAFDVTAPAAGGDASLHGFTLQWSNPNDRLQVEIQISQTVLGTTVVQSYGPFTDTGSRQFLPADLVPYFVQGADLVVTLTKINRGSVAGFASGTAWVRVSVTRSVSPRP